MGEETRKGKHLGISGVVDMACVLAVVVITGISPCVRAQRVHTQGQAVQEFPGGPVVKNVPAIW